MDDSAIEELRSPRRRRWSARTAGRLAPAVLGLLLLACGSSTGLQDRVHLTDRVFAPPTAEEIQLVEQEWSARRTPVEGVRVEAVASMQLAGFPSTTHILSHLVDGHRHYGIVVVPARATPNGLPVLVYAHGGDHGVSLSEVAAVLALLGPRASRVVLVAPSFRSEPVIAGAARYTSEGAASPWDRDVDDALALLDVAIGEVPEADPDRIGVLGISRGGGVGLLMAVRDPRISMIVTFFGPTDFFGAYVRSIVEDALGGGTRDLPGFAVLNERFVQPLREGTIGVPQFRLELVRRSAVLFAARLPPVQVHHGTADAVVDVGQAESLRAALQAGGLERAADEIFIYPGVGHTFLQMPAAPSRVGSFMDRHLLRE
jgi:dipeptidyl aminopeptidase/acylaminoacyl peptidase